MSLLLRNLRCWSKGRDRRTDVRVRRGRVESNETGLAPRRREATIDLDGYLVFPGLINGHDHLDLDLLPPLGTPPYENSYQWAEDIYRPHREPIRSVLAAPIGPRLQYAGLRNLVAGATTVVHHNPYRPRWFLRHDFPVHVPRGLFWSHSIRYGGDLSRAHRRSRGRPWMIHAAEGVDGPSSAEVDQLDERHLLDRNTVLIHGVAISRGQGERLSQVGACLVWCPSSNLRLFGRTAPVDQLHARIPIALGTDSTLTGSAHLLEEMRIAAGTGLASADELLRMVTSEAARLFGLPDRGHLEAGARADLLVIEDRGSTPAEALLSLRPRHVQAVLRRGRPRLASPALAPKLGLSAPNVVVEGRLKTLDPPLEPAHRLLRRAIEPWILDKSPCWKLLAPLSDPEPPKADGRAQE